MVVSLSMEVASMVEDILSDEYEEGEILDDDILYDDVSSLELFSDTEERTSSTKSKETKNVKTKRKKEHVCKEDSLCRLERSGKHCYARVQRRKSGNSDTKYKSAGCLDSEGSERSRRVQSVKSVSPNRGFRRDSHSKESTKGKGKSEGTKRDSPYYFQHDNRLQPSKRVVPERVCKRNRRSSADDHRGSNRKRRSRSPSPKKFVQTNPPKSSLLERLVASGSIPKVQEVDAKLEEQTGSGTEFPVDIGHPLSKPSSPPPQEFEELHLRVNALKTAIMKKHIDLKRKKRLASSKKRESADESSKIVNLRKDDAVPTPPPPGTDWPLGDNRWSDEDMVIDQEGDELVIESNVPTSNPLQPFEFAAASPSSHELPCCRGNPIPVLTSKGRNPRDIDPGKKPPSSVIPIVYNTEEPSSARNSKYLNEINSNRPLKRRRRSQGLQRRNHCWPPRRRRNSIRQGLNRPGKPPPDQPSKPIKDDDDEDNLRKLALMSVKPKIQSGLLTAVSNIDPISIDTNVLPKSDSPKNQSPAETWDDLDEDILRAQLLSSLSRNIPDGPIEPPKPAEPKKQILTKQINKENFYRRTASKPLKKNPTKFINSNVKPSLTPPLNPPKMEKFIIKVSDSETSEEEEVKNSEALLTILRPTRQKTIIELSIDRLLEETRKETELIEMASKFYPDFTVPEASSKTPSDSAMNENGAVKADVVPLAVEAAASPRKPEEVVTNSAMTNDNQGMSKLPAWQQEEFERQKRLMARRESVIEATKQKIRAVNESLRHERKPLVDCSKLQVGETNTSGTVTKCSDIKTGSSNDNCVPSCAKATPICPEGELSSTVSTDSIDLKLPAFAVESESVSAPRCFEEVTEAVENTASLTATQSLDVLGSLPESSDVTSTNVMSDVCRDTMESVQDDTPVLNPCSMEDNSDEQVGSDQCGNLKKSPEDVSYEKEKLQEACPTRTLLALPDVTSDLAVLKNSVGHEKSAAPLTIVPESNSLQCSSGTEPLVSSKPILRTKSIAGIAQKSLQQSKNPPVAKGSIAQPATAIAPPQKTTASKDSSYAAKALNEMVVMVTDFEDRMSEYRNLKKNYIVLRKQLVMAHQEMTNKRQALLGMKGTIETKRKLLDSTLTMDTSSLSPLPDPKDQSKPSSRDSELFALRYKEVCLRAQFAAMGLEAAKPTVAKTGRPVASKPSVPVLKRPMDTPMVSPRKKPKLRPRQVEKLRTYSINRKLVRPPVAARVAPNPMPKTQPTVPSSSKKLVISVTNKDSIDPHIPLCPYDIAGVCKDEECKYQHVRTE